MVFPMCFCRLFPILFSLFPCPFSGLFHGYSHVFCFIHQVTRPFLSRISHGPHVFRFLFHLFRSSKIWKKSPGFSILHQAKINCESPDSTDGYLVTERSTVAQLFDVSVSCARGWEGTAAATPCAASGEKYTLTGCSHLVEDVHAVNIHNYLICKRYRCIETQQVCVYIYIHKNIYVWCAKN